MSDIIQINDVYYVRATSSMADGRTNVLKYGETFAVFDRHGDIQPAGAPESGIFHDGTRFLSTFVLAIDKQRLLPLNSAVGSHNFILNVDLTNAEVVRDGQIAIPQETLHVNRCIFLWRGACYERITLTNYGDQACSCSCDVTFDADYADIFQVRGLQRNRMGQFLSPDVGSDAVRLAYQGLDEVTRRTTIRFSRSPDELGPGAASFHVSLNPQRPEVIDVITTFGYDEGLSSPTLDEALDRAEAMLAEFEAEDVELVTSSEEFTEWLSQSWVDIRMLVSETEHGLYPFAGVPWFSTVFGRDGIIAALQTLWLKPEISRGVLAYLAAHQAESVDPEREAEPGKILHEVRRGEMAALGEIPFGRYYGSVDVTPLFVMLSGAYLQRTADRAFIESIWPNIDAALGWIDTYGDIDGDGFIEYAQHNARGLVHQGWKDSHDSIFHEDGSEPASPIALSEVQGYVYAAWRAAATIARTLGDERRASALVDQADNLKTRFDAAFWLDDLNTYAIALDGDKRPCRVRSSNAGQCLFSGIATPDRALRVAETLMGSGMFSGWGVRTVETSAARYNPMSYHNGSVWPHDNALIAMGLARYGLMAEALQVTTGLFDASTSIELHRLPELLCGFTRRPRVGPTPYPVACAPQAWAAGSAFMLLEACLGMEINAGERLIRFTKPTLPSYLDEIYVRNLRVGESELDLSFHQHPEDVGIQVIRRTGPVDVIVVK